jgi:drug/metabolite transporter (DMT)-like permease
MGVVIGFAGVLVIFAPWQSGEQLGWGAPLLAVAAACYALAFVVMSRRLLPTAATPSELAAMQMLIAAGLAGFALPIEGASVVLPSWWGGLALLMLGLLCTALTFAITYRLLAADGATNTAVVGYLLPVVSIALGAVFLGERFGWRILLGMGVVLTGVGLTRWTRASRPIKSPLSDTADAEGRSSPGRGRP